MFLSKSSSGIYYLWYTVDGKRRRTSTRSKQKHVALAFLRTFRIVDYQRDHKRSQTPLQSFISDFLKHAAGVYAPSTTTIFELSLNNLLEFTGNVPIGTLTPKEYDAYVIHRLKKIKPVSVNIELRTIKSAFNTALRWEMIKSNPFAKQKLLSIPETAPVFFSNVDFHKLISRIKEGWLKEIVVFAVLTGLRRGEIVNLCWQDVSLSNRTIKIQSSLKFKTKTRKNRVIPLSDTAIYLLQSKENKNLTDQIFTLNDQPINPNWVTHKFKYYVYECKFAEDRLHFHSLRHTFASWLVQDGVSIYAVKELLGHTDIKTTQIYSHLQPALLHETVNKIKVLLNF